MAKNKDKELSQINREIREGFFVPPPLEEVFSNLDEVIDKIDVHYTDLVGAFRYNMRSVLSSVSIPFTLAWAGVEKSQFQRIHIAELIRDERINPDRVDDVAEREVYEKAILRMSEFAGSEKGRATLIRDLHTFLYKGPQAESLKIAAKELTQQGIILIWFAFEVLCRDLFELELNNDPAKVILFSSDASLRKRFELEKYSLETLAQYGFDLSNKMGTVLVAQRDLSDLPTIKAVLSALFSSSAALTNNLNDPDLWLLFQRRHLFVHRRGIVDQSYLNNTNDLAALGSTLKIGPDDVEHYFNCVLKTSESLLHCLPEKDP